MPRKIKETEEQLDLIKVGPENSKAIAKVVRKYKAAQSERMAWLADEKKHKSAVLGLVKDAGLKPIGSDGVIRFSADGAIITITPRDELIQVKFDGEEESDE